MARNGQFIYLRTRGYLEIDRDTNKVHSFCCINTLIPEEEGKRLVQEMKRKFSIIINPDEMPVSDSDELGVENPHQIERAIMNLITDLASAPNASYMRYSDECDPTTNNMRASRPANDNGVPDRSIDGHHHRASLMYNEMDRGGGGNASGYSSDSAGPSSDPNNCRESIDSMVSLASPGNVTSNNNNHNSNNRNYSGSSHNKPVSNSNSQLDVRKSRSSPPLSIIAPPSSEIKSSMSKTVVVIAAATKNSKNHSTESDQAMAPSTPLLRSPETQLLSHGDSGTSRPSGIGESKFKPNAANCISSNSNNGNNSRTSRLNDQPPNRQSVLQRTATAANATSTSSSSGKAMNPADYQAAPLPAIVKSEYQDTVTNAIPTITSKADDYLSVVSAGGSPPLLNIKQEPNVTADQMSSPTLSSVSSLSNASGSAAVNQSQNSTIEIDCNGYEDTNNNSVEPLQRSSVLKRQSVILTGATYDDDRGEDTAKRRRHFDLDEVICDDGVDLGSADLPLEDFDLPSTSLNMGDACFAGSGE